MTADGDQGLWREKKERRNEKGQFQPQKGKHTQPELRLYAMLYIFSS